MFLALCFERINAFALTAVGLLTIWMVRASPELHSGVPRLTAAAPLFVCLLARPILLGR